MRNFHALFINPGPTPPNADPRLDRIAQLSPQVGGVVLQSSWGEKDAQGNLKKSYERCGFRYCVIHTAFTPNPLKLLLDISFFVYRGVVEHYFGKKFDLVISYGMTRTGLSALLISLLIRRPLLVEVPGRPTDAHLVDVEQPSVADRFKNWLTVSWCKILFRAADTIRLFYKDQLDEFSGLEEKRIVSFPDYVPVNAFCDDETEGKYILFLGFPWALKGVDTIIKAFRLIEDRIPEYRLKVVGHCPDRRPFVQLASGSKQIEFHAGVRYSEAISLIQKSSFLVLASKTEGMPRVIVEAMAASKAFVATRVGGIPEYTTDGVEGFQIAVGDVEALAERMLRLAQNSELRKQMGTKGYEKVVQLWSEGAHSNNFVRMIAETVEDRTR